MTRAFGRVLSVREREAGALLAQDQSASDTVLVLDDVSQFGEVTGDALIRDEDGNTEAIVITAFDAEADEITLASGLVSGWSEGDVVLVQPSIVTRYAMVAVDGAEDDAVEAIVPSQVAHLLSVGTRVDEAQERVTIEFERETSTWIVIHVWVTNALGIDLNTTDETTLVSPTSELDFDPAFFEVSDGGDGLAGITFIGTTGVSDHGALTGLADDDHPQYLTEAEGDAAYADISEPIAAAHLTDATDAHDASAVSIVDTGNYYSGTEVEAALQELGAAIGGTTIDVEDDTTPVASASTLDFGTGLSVTDNGGGNVTIDATGTSSADFLQMLAWGF